MRRILLTFMACAIANAVLFAQGDSVVVTNRSKAHRVFANRWMQSAYIGVPLIAAGALVHGENNHFRTLRNDFIPDFKNSTDNYIQYLPAAAMLGMKIAGVKGRSSWGKMLTADGFTVALMLATTRGVKPLARVQRPDGSAFNSFPSGHTATAFMAATMLHKEYGQISPWISVGGYAVATATGVMRMMNNRHWMGDVVAGAGFGILCTEFGYWLADLCFPSSNRSYNANEADLTDPDRRPSFVGLTAGFYVPLKKYRIADSPYRCSTGGTMGVEGAYFFDRHWGIGAQVNVANMDLVSDAGEAEQAAEEVSTHFVTGQVGGYFSQKLCDRLFFRAKLLGGAVAYPSSQDVPSADARKAGICGTTGVALGLRAKDHFDVTAGVDYTALSPYDRGGSMRSTIVVSGTALIRF